MLNVKAVVAAFNQEKALVGAFSVITNLRMELFEALFYTPTSHTTINNFKDCQNWSHIANIFVGSLNYC